MAMTGTLILSFPGSHGCFSSDSANPWPSVPRSSRCGPLAQTGRDWPGTAGSTDGAGGYHPAVGLGGWTLALGLVALLVPAPVAARAAAPSVPSGQGLPCTAEWVVRLDQPISMTGSFGQFTSGGETGFISCQGSLGGQPVTGPGTYGESGAFGPGRVGGADCTNGGGAGGHPAPHPNPPRPRPRTGMAPLHLAGAPRGGFGGRVPAP